MAGASLVDSLEGANEASVVGSPWGGVIYVPGSLRSPISSSRLGAARVGDNRGAAGKLTALDGRERRRVESLFPDLPVRSAKVPPLAGVEGRVGARGVARAAFATALLMLAGVSSGADGVVVEVGAGGGARATSVVCTTP